MNGPRCANCDFDLDRRDELVPPGPGQCPNCALLVCFQCGCVEGQACVLGTATNPFEEIDAARKSRNPERRDRTERTLRLRAKGAALTSDRLNVPRPATAVIRDRQTKERGQKYLSSYLNVPNEEIATPQSRRGQRELKWKVATR